MVSTVTNSEPNRRPAAVLAGTMLVYRPRFSLGAYSARNAPAPAYSPDAEKPWTIRITSSSAGASSPIWAYDGRKAMRKVDPDMIRIDQDKAQRRPNLSPNCPQIIPPSGRTKNDMAKMPHAASNPAVMAAWGKKTTAMVVAR